MHIAIRAGGNRGAGGHLLPPTTILADSEANPVPSKVLVILIGRNQDATMKSKSELISIQF